MLASRVREFSARARWPLSKFPAIPLLAVGVVTVAAAVLHFQIMRGSPLDLRVDAPDRIRGGQRFAVTVSVRNPSATETVSWTGVELDNDYSTIESSDPAWQSVDYESGRLLFKFGSMDIRPSASAQVTLTFQARDSETLKSDVTVYSPGPLGMSCPAATVRIRTIVDATP